MEAKSPHQVPVLFLGSDEAVADRLASCYARIAWGAEYRIAPFFSRHPREAGNHVVPAAGRCLAFVEVSEGGGDGGAELIRALRARNPSLQIALVADDAVDYFRIAEEFRIGNVIKRNGFDESMIRALTIRLLTGNIFGFEPYFPSGYTVGPLFRTYSGTVEMEEAIREAYALCRAYVPQEEEATLKIFLHELMTNTFAYAIEGITPEDRDAKLLRPPPQVYIAERRAIKISVVADHEKLGFSLQDSTGSLSMLRLLQKLRRQSRIGGEKAPPGVWDESGRGMSMVYRYSRFIVNILKGVRTETIFLQYRRKELNRYESIIITEVNPF